MAYDVNLLTTAADCDTLTEVLQKEKKDLAYSKTVQLRQQENTSEDSVSVAAEIAANDAELSALDIVIAALPDGDTQRDNVSRKKKLEWRQSVLGKRKDDTGPVALLDRAYTLACIDLQIAEADVLLAAVAARKAAL